MNKQKKPRNYALVAALLVFIMAALPTILLNLESKGTIYSPMDEHIKYIQAKHNDSCQYNMGECPQIECSHSSIK